jgi:hypothetical protein
VTIFTGLRDGRRSPAGDRQIPIAHTALKIFLKALIAIAVIKTSSSLFQRHISVGCRGIPIRSQPRGPRGTHPIDARIWR